VSGKRFSPYRLFVGAIVPNCVMELTDLSQTAKLCLARLYQYAGQDTRCYPAINSLALALGVKRSAAKRAIQELVEYGLLERIERTGGNGRRESNDYHFLRHHIFDREDDATTPPPGPKMTRGARSENDPGARSENDPGIDKVLRESVRSESNDLTAPARESAADGQPLKTPPPPPASTALGAHAPKPPHVLFMDRFKETYEQVTGEPYAYRREDFVMVAAKIKEFGEDAVGKKVVLLAQMCSDRSHWFTKAGWSDFSIGKLVKFWNEILPPVNPQADRDREFKQRMREQEVWHERVAALSQ
jgi:GntR family transcriptional regulator